MCRNLIKMSNDIFVNSSITPSIMPTANSMLKAYSTLTAPFLFEPAILIAQEKYPNVKYILKTLPDSQNPELQQLAVSLNVIKYTEFISKLVDYNELPEMLYGVDIFISVPSSDSSSISLLEAMACGLPVIVSDIPANHEWVTDGWNGIIVPVRDPEKLAEAILHLIEKPDLMRLFGERNARIIREKADREKHMAHMEELYQQLLETNYPEELS